MPELPEVETVRRGLAPHLENRACSAPGSASRACAGPSPPIWMHADCAIGASNAWPARQIPAGCNSTHGCLICHLGMSGSLRLEIATDLTPGKARSPRSAAG
jgi:formamidopyrimidine-DNA glycosylase